MPESRLQRTREAYEREDALWGIGSMRPHCAMRLVDKPSLWVRLVAWVRRVLA